MLQLSQIEKKTLETLLARSPGNLARSIDCSVAHARALQKYIVCIITADYRNKRGECYADLDKQAVALWNVLPYKVRHAIQDGVD